METVFFARFSQPFREFMFSHFEPERPTNMISLDSCIFACFMTLHKYTPFTNSQAPSEKEKIKYRTREHRACVSVLYRPNFAGARTTRFYDVSRLQSLLCFCAVVCLFYCLFEIVHLFSKSPRLCSVPLFCAIVHLFRAMEFGSFTHLMGASAYISSPTVVYVSICLHFAMH